ncbi:MAG: LysR family transcriptional regulator [Deltaproteobacteria bacterium]
METPSLETRDLLLIRALADHGGVTRAASALHLSQSAVSHHLARLEAKLELTLFDRVGRGLEMTRHGHRLLEGAEAILSELSALERRLKPEAPTRLRVATQCHTAYEWLAPVLRRFEERHPSTTVRLVTDAARAPLDALDEGRVDVAIAHAKPRRAHRARFLVDDRFCVVLPRAHALSAKKSLKPQDLADETLVVHDLPVEELRKIGRELFGAQPPRRLTRIPVTEGILELVANAYGVSIMPGWAAGRARTRDDLVVRRLASTHAKRRWRAVWRKDAAAKATIPAFVEALVAWFEPDAP